MRNKLIRTISPRGFPWRQYLRSPRQQQQQTLQGVHHDLLSLLILTLTLLSYAYDCFENDQSWAIPSVLTFALLVAYVLLRTLPSRLKR